MRQDPVHVVRSGYEALGPRYLEWTLSVDPVHRETYQAMAVDRLEPDSMVVELGCGPGTTAGAVAQRHRYVGVDLSASQLRIARSAVPSGRFVLADMTDVALRPGSVDAVVAFYSLIHVPREQHARLLRSVRSWLRPGGVFTFNLGTNDDPGGTYEWIDGVPMYWSAFDPETGAALVRDSGLEVLRHEVLTNFEDDTQVRFSWFLATRAATPRSRVPGSRDGTSR